MLNVLNFSKNKLHHRCFDNNLQKFLRTNTLEKVTGHIFLDSCINGRFMLKQLNDLNSKWKELIKRMPSLLAAREICYILVVDEDLPKVVKIDQDSSPDSLLFPWNTFILLVTHFILISMYFYYILTYGAMSRSKL